MNATAIISTLTIAKANGNKLETAVNVLSELHEMKKLKGMPFFAISRAIRIQQKIVDDIKNQ